MSTHPQKLGKYEMRERLGRGGMAEVWKAFDTQLHRYVAIKLMHADLQNDPEFMTRFVREARAIASLHHSNIVQIYDFQTTDTTDANSPLAYMVMDYVEGQTLADYMRNTVRIGKFLNANELVQLFASISRAIDYAHRQGMLHRDIKPANILLDKRNTLQNAMGEPVLSDFGIAKLVGITGGTVQGTWLGTPMYVSPEQVQGQPGDERSDIYSLGIILYEMCTGSPPFRGDTLTAIIMQQVNTIPTDPAIINPNISPELSAVIMRCIAKNPADRFGSASALTVALAEALHVPVPSDLNIPSLQAVDALEAPTYLTPSSALYDPAMNAPTYLIPSPSNQVPNTVSANPPSINTPAYAQQHQETPGTTTPTYATALPSSLPSSPPRTPIPAPPSPGTPTFAPKRSRRGLLIAVILLAILVVSASSLGAFYWFSHKATPTAASSVGNVYFVSSEKTDMNSNVGANDEMQIDLHNLANPASGQVYYAWLLSDNTMTEAASLFLGTLKVSNGQVHYLYMGDAQHSNLLISYSRFLITEEAANPIPIAPSVDHHAWQYYAELPQTPSKVDNFSLLDHLRHLLAKDPELEPLNLPGGLEIWLFRNTQGVMQRAVKAQGCWHSKDTGCIQRAVIRILDYLDGKNYVQMDVPQGTSLLIDARTVSVALLEFDPQTQNPPGYLFHINRHLQGIVQAPGVTAAQQKLAGQIDTGLNILSNTLNLIHNDAKQLINLPQNQLLSNSTLTILNDMATQANYAFNGQVNSGTNLKQGGAVEIYQNSQRLATFDVMTYSQNQ
jgi:eukaryotic-like serine/threonine-protein kinase